MTEKIVFTPYSPELNQMIEFVVGNFAWGGHHVPAVQVTDENIGKLSLLFRAEIMYRNDEYPYFRFDAKRGDGVRTLIVNPTNWILPLWDELYVWDDVTFTTTFGNNQALKDYAMQDAKATAEHFGQNIAWEEAEMRETLAGDLAPNPLEPKFKLDQKVTLTEHGRMPLWVTEIISPDDPTDNFIYGLKDDEGGYYKATEPTVFPFIDEG